MTPTQPPSTTPRTSAPAHPYARLDPDLVMDAVESLGLLCDARVFALNSYENRVYQVGIDEQAPLIAKFYRPERWSEAQIGEEHALLQELAAADLPVVAPWASESGATLHHYQGFRFTLFPRRGGQAPELDNPDNLSTLGRCLGRIHAIGAARPFRERPQLDTESYGHRSRQLLLDGGFLTGDLRKRYERLSTQLLERCEALITRQPDLRRLRLHGDCHVGNILWRDNAPHFVDFDDARMGPAVQDLWMLLSGDPHQQQAQLSEIVEGYEEFFEFDRRELRLVEALRTLRLMHYSAWLASRWQDPAFPASFPWFNSDSYWQRHLKELEEQLPRLESALSAP